MPPDQPLPNSTESRTTTGEIKDQSPTKTTDQTQGSDQTSTSNQNQQQPPKATDTKPEPGKEGEKSLLNKDEKKPDASQGAPEKYEFKAPEGYELDEKAIEAATPVFKELGLSQEAAQKLVDLYSNMSKETAEAPYKLWQDMNKKWADEVKADPQLGPRLDQVKQNVSRALDSIGDPALTTAFKEAMDLTGAGNHPAFVKVIDRLAAHFIEGKHVSGNNPSPHGQTAPGAAPQSAAKAMYPNLP